MGASRERERESSKRSVNVSSPPQLFSQRLPFATLKSKKIKERKSVNCWRVCDVLTNFFYAESVERNCVTASAERSPFRPYSSRIIIWKYIRRSSICVTKSDCGVVCFKKRQSETGERVLHYIFPLKFLPQLVAWRRSNEMKPPLVCLDNVVGRVKKDVRIIEKEPRKCARKRPGVIKTMSRALLEWGCWWEHTN